MFARLRSFWLLTAVLAAAPAVGVALAQSPDRAVRILEEAPKKPAAAPEPPAAIPTPPPAEAALKPPPPTGKPAPGEEGDNPSGLSVDVLPGKEIPLGAQIAFRVSTKKPGYLVLVDIDSAGKLTQIYPNPISMLSGGGESLASNLIQPGAPTVVPDAKEAKEYEFIASPPIGVGMIVGILSDQPVQVVDLPDIPAALAGQRRALDFVQESTRALRIIPEEAGAEVIEPKWSFDTKFYAIK